MSVSSDRWTCPDCGRTVVIVGTDADTACCIRAVQERHSKGHAEAAAVLSNLGLAGAAQRRRGGRNRARRAS